MYTAEQARVNASTRGSRQRLPEVYRYGSIGAMPHRALLAAPTLALLACGGGTKLQTITITPPPPPTTTARLVGPLCKPEVCTCRDASAAADGGAGVPADGVKRFEFRVGPSEHPLWVLIDGTVLYKSAARAEDCFYVDLAPGDHSVRLRASHAGGISAGLFVSEYGAATRSWYDTYAFSCGVPGVCAHEDLDEYKAGLAQFARGRHDPCGSVRIKGLTWDTGAAPDQVHPDELALGMTFQVYDFAPRAPHGDASCSGTTK